MTTIPAFWQYWQFWALLFGAFSGGLVVGMGLMAALAMAHYSDDLVELQEEVQR